MYFRVLLLVLLAAARLASAFDGVVDPGSVAITEKLRFTATPSGDFNENAKQLVVSPDGSYFTLWREVHRYSTTSFATDRAVIRKFNSDGTLAWTRARTVDSTSVTSPEPATYYTESWGESDPGHDISGDDASYTPNVGRAVALPDGGIVVAFDLAQLANGQQGLHVEILHRTLFVKFDANGNFVWRNPVGVSSIYPAYVQDLRISPDGGVVALCYTAAASSFGSTSSLANHQTLVRKVSSSNGALVFDGEYGGGDTDLQALALGIDAQSRIYVLSAQAGDVFQAYDPTKSAYVLRRISPDGDTVERAELPISGEGFTQNLSVMAVDAAGNCYVAGSYLAAGGSKDVGERGVVVKVNTSLAQQWQSFGPLPKRYFNDRPGSSILRIQVSPQGLTTLGNTRSGGVAANENLDFGETMRFDFDGNLVWHRYLEPQVVSSSSGSTCALNDLEITAQGDVFERGSQTVDASTGSLASFVSKYSSDGVLQFVKLFPNDLSAKMLQIATNGTPTVLAQPFVFVDTDAIVTLNNPANLPAPNYSVQVTGILEGHNFKNAFGETIDFGAKTTPASVAGVTIARVEYYIDGVFVRGGGVAPFTTELFVEDVGTGAHTIFVRAFPRGLDPVDSAPVHFTVGLNPGSPTTLTVQINGPAGSGKVTAGFLGETTRKLGDQVAITATPNAGYIFTGWTGSVPTNSATVSFTIQPGLTLTANFVPSPFAGAAGTYAGIAEITAGAGLNTAAFTVTVNANGHFSGKLAVGTFSVPISGTFQADGTFTKSFKVANRPVTVSLSLGNTNDLRTVNGTIDVAGISYVVSATARTFNAQHPAPQAGRYTFVLPSLTAAGAPGGDNWFTAKVSANGTVVVAGSLSDGTKIARSGALSADGSFPLYAPLYKNRGGLGGEVTFANPRLIGEWFSDVDGTLFWQKPAAASTAAFAAQGQVVGSYYTAPDSAHTAFNLSPGNLLLAFTSTPTIANVNANLTANGKSTSSLTGFGLRAQNAAGTFSGKVPSTSGSASYSGVVLQKQGVARGYVRGSASGGVLITPLP